MTVHLKLQRYLMLMIGTWKFRGCNSPFLILYKAYSVFIFWHYIVIAQLVIISVPMQWECTTRVIQLICYYIQYTNNIVMMSLSMFSSMPKVFDYILDYEENMIRSATKLEQQIYQKYAKLNNRLSLVVAAMLVGTAIYWYTISVRHSIYGESTVACPLTKGTVYQIWFSLKMWKYPWLVIVNEIIFFISVINITMYREILMFSISIFMLGQIKILQQNVRDLEKDCKEMQKLYKINFDEAILMSVNNCVRKHQRVINLMKMMQSTTSIFILVLYFSNALEMAAYLLQLISEKSIYNIMSPLYIFTMMISQLYIFYKYTNEILVGSTALCDIIYNETNWLNYNQVAKKHLLLMMIRSQNRLSFKAAGLGDMSLETFTKLIKLCYSIVACIKTAYDV